MHQQLVYTKCVLRLLKLTHHCSLLLPLLQLDWHPQQACPLQLLKAIFSARLLNAMTTGTITDLQVHSLLLHSGSKIVEEGATPT